MKLILATQLICTLGMFGVIWVVQLVHYPLFDRVDRGEYRQFQQAHEARISFVVLPLMLGELATSAYLAWRFAGTPTTWIWMTGLGLVAAVWLSTFFLSVPLHQRLNSGFDPEVHHQLVITNWPRTLIWSVRALLVVYATFQVLATDSDRAASVVSKALP